MYGQAKLGELAALMNASESQQASLLDNTDKARAHVRMRARARACTHPHVRTHARFPQLDQLVRSLEPKPQPTDLMESQWG